MSDLKFVAEIIDGRLDDDLDSITKAVQSRIVAGAAEHRWHLTLDDETWSNDDITLGEIRFVEKATGLDWSRLDPTNSADQLMLFLVAHLHQIRGVPRKEAADRVEAIPLDEAMKTVLRTEVVAVDPKERSGA